MQSNCPSCGAFEFPAFEAKAQHCNVCEWDGAPVVGTWQPIATAPLKKRILLAGVFDGIQWIAIGHYAEGEFHSEPAVPSPLRFPTHWMELPELPVIDAQR